MYKITNTTNTICVLYTVSNTTIIYWYYLYWILCIRNCIKILVYSLLVTVWEYWYNLSRYFLYHILLDENKEQDKQIVYLSNCTYIRMFTGTDYLHHETDTIYMTRNQINDTFLFQNRVKVKVVGEVSEKCY